jgi:hypothetical protein
VPGSPAHHDQSAGNGAGEAETGGDDDAMEEGIVEEKEEEEAVAAAKQQGEEEEEETKAWKAAQANNLVIRASPTQLPASQHPRSPARRVQSIASSIVIVIFPRETASPATTATTNLDLELQATSRPFMKFLVPNFPQP